MERTTTNPAIVRAEPNPFPNETYFLLGDSSLSSYDSDSDSLGEVTFSFEPPTIDLSSLFQHLPAKRGLSEFYDGKSQSFSSLTDAMRLEDLAKPENPYNKRLKMRAARSRSFEGRARMGDTIDEGICKASRVSSQRSI